MGSIMVTGGAGYIGSHVALGLLDAGHGVVVLDDLSTGRRDHVPSGACFVEASVGDAEAVARVLTRYGVAAVVHLAGSTIVPESIRDPIKYYTNNTVASLSLLDQCVRRGVEAFVFSSTAAVYGQPERVPVSEAAAPRPISPYGRSKLAFETMLADTAMAYELSYIALRYFNVAGADPLGRAGQSTSEATHLVKVAAEAAVGRRPVVEIFGDDYDTPDGTAVRDYIHVSDLADAHVMALRHLASGGGSAVLNCGYGRGFSVREVLKAVEGEIGRALPARVVGRRAGDPACIVADASAIERVLGWRPRYNDLQCIVRASLAWERKLAAEDEGAEPMQWHAS